MQSEAQSEAAVLDEMIAVAEHDANGTSKNDIYEELFGDVPTSASKKKKPRSKPCPKSRKKEDAAFGNGHGIEGEQMEEGSNGFDGEQTENGSNGIEGEHMEQESNRIEGQHTEKGSNGIGEEQAKHENNGIEGENKAHSSNEQLSTNNIRDIEDVLADFEEDSAEPTNKLEESKDEDELLVNEISVDEEETEEIVVYHVEYPESEKSEADQINITASAFLIEPCEDERSASTSTPVESLATTSRDSPTEPGRTSAVRAKQVFDETPFIRYIPSVSARRPLHETMYTSSLHAEKPSSSVFSFLGFGSTKTGQVSAKRKADWDETEEQQVSKKVKASRPGLFSLITSPVMARFRGVSYKSEPEKVEIVRGCVLDAADVSSGEEEDGPREEVVGKEELPEVVGKEELPVVAEETGRNRCVLM